MGDYTHAAEYLKKSQVRLPLVSASVDSQNKGASAVWRLSLFHLFTVSVLARLQVWQVIICFPLVVLTFDAVEHKLCLFQ